MYNYSLGWNVWISKANHQTNKYVAEKYDRFTATFPKGKKEEYRVHAEKKGLSLNGLINELIEDDIAKYKK